MPYVPGYLNSYTTTSNLSIGLVLLRLNVPVNNFSVMSGRSHRFLGITSTFRGVNVSSFKDFSICVDTKVSTELFNTPQKQMTILVCYCLRKKPVV